MRPDRATRGFLTLLAVALLVGALVFCGALGGVLIPLLLSRLSGDGFDAFVTTSMLPVLVVLVLVMAGVGVGARSLMRQLLASRRLARYVSARAAAVPDVLLLLAARVGLQGRVMLVDASESFSFVYGVLTPRVAVSRGLVEATSVDELRAVIEHESYHVRNLDPLKIVLTRSLSAALFFFPVLNALRARYVTDCELAADRQAVARCGDRSLAGALLKAIRGPSWNELNVAASIGGPDVLDVRVLQLETGAEPRSTAIGRRPIALSILSATFFTLVYLASAYSLGGPATVSGLASSTVLDGLLCGTPFAAVAIALYLFVATRARRPVR
jgi:beta-lactamase regulating signal transducer with metallopeptidase domain